MRSFFFSLLLFVCSSVIVLFFAHSVTSAYSIVQFIALLLIAIVVLVTIFYQRSVPSGIKWVLLGSATLITQLLVATNGGLYSPFLILFHFLGLGIHLFFPLSTSVLFVVFTFLVLAGTLVLDGTALDVWSRDPAVPLLYSVSFLSIIPLAHILANKYKFTDTLVGLMSKQIEVEETIISALNELVFVTDREGRILAVNDAAEQALHKSNAELLHNQLFSALLLRDNEGMVVTKESVKLDVLLKEKMPLEMSHLSLLGSASFAEGQVSIRLRPITNVQGVADQISVIVSQVPSDARRHLEEAVARHDAMIEELQGRLRATDAANFSTFVLVSKAEKDILTARAIDEKSLAENKVAVDIASLCKDVVAGEADFATGFSV